MTSRTAASERQRRRRARQAAGVAVLKIEVPLFETADALVQAGYLAEWDADDPAAIRAALETMVRYLSGVTRDGGGESDLLD